MEAIFDVTAWVGLGLMVCNWQWDWWGHKYRRCVPGSLHQAQAAAMRRRYRWPGFLFWPMVIPGWLHEVGTGLAEGSHWTWLWLLLSVLAAFSLRSDYRKLRRELDEDEDDWLNKGKRKLKKLARAAARSLAAGAPRPAYAPF